MHESVKSTLRKLIAQATVVLTHLAFEQTREPESLVTKPLRNLSSSPSLQMDANHPRRPLAEKNKKRYAIFIVFPLILLLISIIVNICMFTQTASAAGYHTAHTMSAAALAHEADIDTTFLSKCNIPLISLAFKSCRKHLECAFLPVLWSILDPNCSNGGDQGGAPWSFPCSDTDSQGTVNAGVIASDWLSGDPPSVPAIESGILVNGGGTSDGGAGHFFITSPLDTYSLPSMQSLFAVMQATGFVLLCPVIILMGYQILWTSWTFRYASVLSLLPQFLLSVMAITVSMPMISILIDLEGVINSGLMALHTEFPFPQISINGTNVALTLNGDSPNSLRAIIMPISRWGCQANSFIGILESKFVTDVLGSAIPFIGGLVQLAGTISDGVQLLLMLGSLVICVLSIGIFAQVIFRIIILNYYILLCPVAFACGALPGGVGQSVMRQWFKGFFSILFVQTVQVFVAVTLPLILPAFPQLPWDGTGVLKAVILQLPPIIVLLAISKVPKLMGTKATTAVAQAGTVASGAVVALAGAAWQIV